jgi:hypothetical protein
MRQLPWSVVRRTALCFGLVVLIGNATCGPKAPPTEADARQLFERKLGGPIERGQMRIKSFTQTGGSNLPDGRYSVDYRAEVECLKNLEGGAMNAVLGVVAKQGQISFEHERFGPTVGCAMLFQKAVQHPALTFQKSGGSWRGEE